MLGAIVHNMYEVCCLHNDWCGLTWLETIHLLTLELVCASKFNECAGTLNDNW